MHGCRQLVSWDVRLIPITSATPTVIYYSFFSIVFFKKQLDKRRKKHYNRTAVDKTEEGGDNVKSLCFLWKGLHMWYNVCYRI